MKLQMNAQHLIQCIAGDLLADPSEIFELIREEHILQDAFRECLSGQIDYDILLESVTEYC